MGKIKDPQLFLLIKNFLLVYLPVQRKLSGNTVTTYRTVLNQFLAHVAGAEGIPVMAVTFDMVNAGSVNAYLDSLTGDRGLAGRNISACQVSSLLSRSARATALPKWIT